MIRKLMQYKLSSLLSPLFVVLEVVMEVVIPILMAKLIDDGIDGDGGMDAILHIGGILIVEKIQTAAQSAYCHSLSRSLFLPNIIRRRFFSGGFSPSSSMPSSAYASAPLERWS